MRSGFRSCSRRRWAIRVAFIRQDGFSLIELLIGMSILAVGLLAIATMFSTGYMDVAGGGRTTMAATAARQIIEDIRTLPFDRLTDLDGFNSNISGSLAPVDAALDPGRTWSRNVARKWRYVLAGDGVGWGFTLAEKGAWDVLTASGTPFGARGQIAVVSPSATLRQITVTVFVRGHAAGEELPLTLSTLISRL